MPQAFAKRSQAFGLASNERPMSVQRRAAWHRPDDAVVPAVAVVTKSSASFQFRPVQSSRSQHLRACACEASNGPGSIEQMGGLEPGQYTLQVQASVSLATAHLAELDHGQV